MACDIVWPPNADPFGQSSDPHLNTDGSNCMLGPLKGFSGTPSRPGFAFCAFPSTGLYAKSALEMCVTLSGSTSFCFLPTGIAIYSGAYKAVITHSNTSNHTYNLQDKDGTIAHLDDAGGPLVLLTNNDISVGEGVPVRISGASGFIRAQADSIINEAVGFTHEAIGAGLEGLVRMSNGFIEMSDWTSVIGSATLTVGAEYWLGRATAGTMTTSPS
ncbi:MAG: hypothetical protein KDH96_04160, partial [Candidatus Riesia sp.]|nr:hypothetical protein [Candidatus Riesia sp.]